MLKSAIAGNKNQSNIGNEQITLTKFEREELFQQAETLRAEGHETASVALYLQCLHNLDVTTAFGSLPKCLRALASHFIELKEYEKSVHFIQAERLYYESALLDTASFQKKLNELSNDKFAQSIQLDSSKDEQLEYTKDRAIEYEYLINYFKENQQINLALMYAEKCLKIKTMIYGPDHMSTKYISKLISSLKNENESEMKQQSTFNKNPSYSLIGFQHSFMSKEELQNENGKVDRTMIVKTDANSRRKELFQSVDKIVKLVMLTCIILTVTVLACLYMYLFINRMFNHHVRIPFTRGTLDETFSKRENDIEMSSLAKIQHSFKRIIFDISSYFRIIRPRKK